MHDSSNSDDHFGFTESQTSGRIVANVAHELKTPLAAMAEGHKHIMALLKDARASLSKIPEVSDKLLADLEEAEVTLESTSNLSHFMKMSINRCIEYSHIKESHPLSPNLVSVNLSDALRLPADCVSSIDPQHHLEVVALPPTVCTHVIADLQWLQENLLCLLSNAVKHSNPEKAVHTTLSLSVRTSSSLREEFNVEAPPPPHTLSMQSLSLNSADSAADEAMLLVECEDSGVGMSVDAMQHLFSTEKMSHRQTTGTGLGLLSLYKRMQALGGYCGVRGRRDGETGCLFWFAFPYVADESTMLCKSSSSDVQKTDTTQTPDQYIQPSTTDNTANTTHIHSTHPTYPTTSHTKQTVHTDTPNYSYNNYPTPMITTPLETEQTHDVLSSTLKNVLPSPMLFESDDNTDKFNTYAPFPVYQKRLSSRSLRSAMSNLPTSTSFSTSENTPIGKWENEEEGSGVSSTSGSAANSRPVSTATTGTFSLFSRSNSGTANTRSSKGRSLILSLPTESSSRSSFPSMDVSSGSGGSGGSGNVVGSGVSSSVGVSGCNSKSNSGVGASSNVVSAGNSGAGSGMGSSGNNTNTNPPLPPTNRNTHTTHTSTHIHSNNSSGKHSASSTPLLHGTPPIPHLHTTLHTLALPRTPPRGGANIVRTVEPSPASSTGTPQRATFDNSWTPDCISMIRTHIYNILLVDDTPMILKMTSLLLRRQGFDVTTAQNGAEAFALIQSRRFDVVLMDLQMPVLDGLEAARRIRALEKRCADGVGSGGSGGSGGNSGDNSSVGGGNSSVGGGNNGSGNGTSNNTTSGGANTNTTTDTTTNTNTTTTTTSGISADPLFLIAVSANSDPMIVLETLSAGYDNYIEKPFTVGQFESVLAKYLAKKYYS